MIKSIVNDVFQVVNFKLGKNSVFRFTNGLKKIFAWSFSESVTGSSVDYCTVFTGLKQPFFSLTEGWSLDTLCARGLFKL